jgi:hypothetical protein
MRSQYNKERSSPNARTILVQITSFPQGSISIEMEDRCSKKSKEKNGSERRETAAEAEVEAEAEIEPEMEVEATHDTEATGLQFT